MHDALRVRKALAEDAQTILQLVDGLAAYERLAPPDDAAKRRLIDDMFGARRRIEAFLAEVDDKPAGYAFVYETYSSFLALPTMYLEDLFVLPEYRKLKAGYSLFRAVAREAQLRGCGRMEWTVLDWNTPAIGFYEKIGARHMKEWMLFRLTKEEIGSLCEVEPLDEGGKQ